MNIAVVGSRGFTDVLVISKAIDKLRADHGSIIIVSGGAMGADGIAERYADRLGLGKIIHRPDWNKWGRSAGFRRNASIVGDADLVLAFFAPGPRSRGTQHSVDLAHTMGKPVYVYHEGSWS